MAAQLTQVTAWQSFRKATMLNGGDPHLQKQSKVMFNPEDPEHLKAARNIIDGVPASIQFIVVPPFTNARQMIITALAEAYLEKMK